MIELAHKNHEKCKQMTQHIWNMGGHWYGVEKDCQQYIDQCQICVQDYKKQLKRQPGQFQDPKYPNYRYVIDCVEIAHSIASKYIPNLSKTSKVQILTVIDAFSKKANAYHLQDKSGANMRKVLSQHFAQNQSPEQVLSDNGTEFINQNVVQLMNELGIDYIHGRPYHPQTQGVIERFNQTIQQYLYRRASEDEINQENNNSLQEVLNQVIMAYNNRIHSSHGLTPFEAYRITDQEQQKAIVEKMKTRFPQQKYNYDLKKGDKILVLNDVYLARGSKNLLIRQKGRGKGKRTLSKAKFSLVATVTEDSQFNMKIQFSSGQGFDTESLYYIPTEFVRKISLDLYTKMTKKNQNNNDQLDKSKDVSQVIQKSQQKLKPCLICYEAETPCYTQCCNQPIHLQCYFQAINHSNTCPYCRTPGYTTQTQCLIPDRKYLDDIEESSDDNIEDESQIDQNRTQSNLQPIQEMPELQINSIFQDNQSSQEYDYNDYSDNSNDNEQYEDCDQDQID